MRREFDIIGHVVRAPRLSATARGTERATYIVAVPDDYSPEQSHYFVIHSFGRQAVNDHRYLSEQSLVGVRGAMKQWFDRELRRGGIYFEAAKVDYLARGRAAARAGAPSTHDPEILQFLAEMDGALG